MSLIEDITRFCKTRKSEVGAESFESMRGYFKSFMDNLEARSIKADIRNQNDWCRDKMDDDKFSDPDVAPCNNDMISKWADTATEFNVLFVPNNTMLADDFSHAVLITDTDERIDVPNLLYYISDSAQTIESGAKNLPYVKEQGRFLSSEGKLPIAFVPSFYRFVLLEKRLPTQEEFYEEFRIDLLLSGFDFDRQPEKYRDGLKKRLCSRAYPSIVRDIHFCKLLAEFLPEKGYDVLYNTAIDIKGIDVLIRERATGELTGVCLFVDTKKSNEQIEGHKSSKRRHFKEVHFLEYPIKCDSTSTGIWLYDKSAVNKLYERLKKKDY